MGARHFTTGASAFRNIHAKDHICLFYNSEKERWSFLSPLLRQMEGSRTKFIYLTTNASVQTVARRLYSRGIPYNHENLGSYIRILNISPDTEDFDYKMIVTALEGESAIALSQGYSMVCSVIDMEWAAEQKLDQSEIGAFEENINEFVDINNSVVVCQYDRRVFEPEVLASVLKYHRLVAEGGEIYDNFFCETISSPVGEGESNDPLQHLIDRLAARKHLENALEESASMNEIVMEALPCIAMMLLPEGDVISCNRYAYEHGIKPGMKFYEAWKGRNVEWQIEGITRAMEQGIEVRDEFVEDDSAWEMSWVPIPPDLCLCCCFDITEKKKVLSALRKSEQNFRCLVECASDGICIAQDGTIKYVNWSLSQMLDYSPNSIIGQSFPFAVPEDEANLLVDEYERCLTGTECGHTFETIMIRSSGERLTVEASGGPTIYEGRPAELLLVRDITVRKRAEKKLVHEATHDLLTGVLNRKCLLESFDLLFTEARRRNDYFTFCICDIDDFKQINEEHGHLAGDRAIAIFAEILAGELREADIVGRYGGDEFGIIFQNANPGDVIQALSRIRERCSETAYMEKDGKAFTLSATFGLAIPESKEKSYTDTIRNADDALRFGKRSGKDLVVFNNGEEMIFMSGTPERIPKQ
ncbi:MAG: diguanylate cyclase [Planctomycetes bacterium]|nr:diguanylate cyclase [Planctomycetota bacterium]